MSLHISEGLLRQIERHGESTYPDEGAGLLMGEVRGDDRWVHRLVPLANTYQPEVRDHRYQISAADLMSAEQEAESLGLDLIGVFHSHPDHPAVASEFDLEWALPWFSYLITAVQHGRARQSRSWRLDDDRTQMCEEAITITPSVIRGENQ